MKPISKDIQKIVDKANRFLDTEEGKQQIEEVLKKVKEVCDKLQEDAKVDPEILREVYYKENKNG